MRGIMRGLDERLNLKHVAEALRATQPSDYRSPLDAPPYSLGRMALATLAILLLSGIGLTFFYIPTATAAARTLEELQRSKGLGWLLHNVHRWSALILFLITVLHALRGLLARAYRFPRDVNWWAGLGLLLLVFMLGGTGYLLRWDIKAFSLMDLVISNLRDVPILGPALIEVILGGNPLDVIPLHRGYALHVWGLPLISLILLAAHLVLAWRQGLAESAPRIEAWLGRLPLLSDTGYLPPLLVLLGVLLLSVALVEGAETDPLARYSLPHPDWLLMTYFIPFWFFQGGSRVVGALILPAATLLLLLLLPWLGRERASSLWQTLIAVIGVAGVLWLFGQIAWMGTNVPLPGCTACHRPGILGSAPTEVNPAEVRDADWLVEHLRDPIGSILEPTPE